MGCPVADCDGNPVADCTGNPVVACDTCIFNWEAIYDGTYWSINLLSQECGCCVATDWVVDPDNDCRYTCTTCTAQACSDDGSSCTPPSSVDPGWPADPTPDQLPSDCKPNCIYTWEAVCAAGAWTKTCLSATCGYSADGIQTPWVVDPNNPQRRTCTIAGSNSCTDDDLPSPSCIIANSPVPTDPVQGCVSCHACEPEIPYAITLSGPSACTMGGSSAQLYPFQATAPDNWPGLTPPYPPCLWWIPAPPYVDTWTVMWYDTDPGSTIWTGPGWYGYCLGVMNPAQKFSSNRCDPRGTVGGYTLS